MYFFIPCDRTSVRLVQITLPAGKREAVLSTLDAEDINYVLADETSDREYSAIAFVPLPLNAVEPVLETLRDAGLDEDALTVVTEPTSIVSREFDELEEKYAREQDEDRVARSELRSAAANLVPSMRPYVLMTVLSAVIATAGLLLDSAAVVVGSMVIAPVVGPAMAASIGTVLNDRALFVRGALLQLLGVGLSVGAAFVFALFVRYVLLVPPVADITAIPEIEERVVPDLLTLPIALGAGIAGAVSLTSGAATALVGVMIAVALIPPAATVGIGLAWGQPIASLTAGALLFVNSLSINFGALAVMWLKDYRPKERNWSGEAKRNTITRGAVLAVGIVALSGVLLGVTLDSLEQAETEEQIQSDVDDAIGAVDGEHEMQRIDVEIEYPTDTPFQHPERVIITVGIPPGDPPPALGETIDEHVSGTIPDRTEIDIRYIQQTTG